MLIYSLIVKQRLFLVFIVLLVSVTSCKVSGDANNLKSPSLTELEEFERTNKVYKDNLQDLLANGVLGSSATTALVPIIFDLDGKLLSSEQYNSWEKQGILEDNISLFAYTDFTTFREVMQKRAVQGLRTQAYVEDIDERYVWGMPNVGVQDPELGTQAYEADPEKAIFVFDPYETKHETYEEVLAGIKQKIETTDPRILSERRNLSTQAGEVDPCEDIQLWVGDIVVRTTSLFGVTEYIGHSGMVTYTNDLASHNLKRGNPCDDDVTTVEATGWKSVNSNEIKERSINKGFDFKKQPDVFYAFYPGLTNQQMIELKGFHRDQDVRNDDGQLVYGFPLIGKSGDVDQYSRVYCSLLNWLGYKKVLGVEIDGNGGPLVKPFDLIHKNSPLVVALHVNNGGDAALKWTRQFGTNKDDHTTGIAVDINKNVYVAGWTEGSLQNTNKGDRDAFVSKYSTKGSVLWTKQFGTSEYDEVSGITTNANGNVYVSGYTYGSLKGTNKGFADAYVRKYNSSGKVLWMRQFGTQKQEKASSIAVDTNGNVYMAGHTWGNLKGANLGGEDAFIRKYGASGDVLWTRQFGTNKNDETSRITTDTDGDVYVVGNTSGDLQGTGKGVKDIYIRKYGASGDVLWTRQFGTTNFDFVYGMATDVNKDVYIVGHVRGDLKGANKGQGDAYIRKYSASGKVLWTRQFGTIGGDSASDVAVNVNGSVYVSGSTSGNLQNTSTGGYYDAFIREYSASGRTLWTKQFGTSEIDGAISVKDDAKGGLYIGGRTKGGLQGNNLGGFDFFVRKYTYKP